MHGVLKAVVAYCDGILKARKGENNQYITALHEFIAAAEKLMRFW